MLLKKGIVRKTFLFSVLLIVIVTLISFAVMYFVMPGYYLNQKEKALNDNMNALAQNLQTAKTESEYIALISEFSAKNNANVLSFDSDDTLLPAMSTPFLGIEGGGDVAFFSKQISEADGRQTYILQAREKPSPDAAVRHSTSGLTIRWAQGAGAGIITAETEVGTGLVDHIAVNGTLQPIGEAKGVILSLLPWVLLIAVVMGFALSGIYARQISKPLLQISDAALRMQRMEPEALSNIQTKDELGQLSANLNALYTSLLENIGQLKSEMDKTSRLERSKTELVQSASHELKTPIAALGGMLEGMIDNVGAYKDKEKYLVECKRQVDKLSHLVGEILEASQADASNKALDISDIYADELIERAIAEHIYQIHEKNLKLEQSLSPTLVATDPNLLYRAISNLVSNAVRYTHVGGIIRIAMIEQNAGCCLSIENECDAIPEDDLAKLFEPFYTRSFSRDKLESGTGLGLYIVKRNLERLGVFYEAMNTELGFRVCLVLSIADPVA